MARHRGEDSIVRDVPTPTATARRGRGRRPDDGPAHADYVLAFALYDSAAKVAAALRVTPEAVSAWQSAQRAAFQSRPRMTQIHELLHFRPMRARELATALGLTRHQAKDALKDLLRAGRVVRVERGVFELVSAAGAPKKRAPNTRKSTAREREFRRAFRKLHTASAVADALGVTLGVAYRWLHRLGLTLPRDKGVGTLAERVRGRLQQGPARAGDVAASLGVRVGLVGNSLSAMFLTGRIQRLSRGLFAPLDFPSSGAQAR